MYLTNLKNIFFSNVSTMEYGNLMCDNNILKGLIQFH